MAKTVQQELKELRQRVRQLEGKPGDTAADLVGTAESLRPAKRTFGELCNAVQSNRIDANTEAARSYLEANPNSYKNMDAVAVLAKDFEIPIAVAGQLLHPQE